jgi:hypothetical protein
LKPKAGAISALKKLDDPLASGHLKKLKKYCSYNKVDMGAFTDGGAWYITNFSDLRNPKVTLIDAVNATKRDVQKLLSISYGSL